MPYNAIIAGTMADSPSERAGRQPRMRTVFMGTPDFAIPTLERLLETQEIVGVFTQPDRPAGRGRRVRRSPVKRLAESAGVAVYQPKSFRRDPTVAHEVADLAPDVIVVAAYGLILSADVLAVPKLGALNVHASLLPRWRGAAPVTHALLEGDEETGISIMLIDVGLDTGPILAQEKIAVPATATAGKLTGELARLGARLVVRTLPRWAAGEIEPVPQDEALVTYAPLVTRQDARLDWSRPAEFLERQVRAMNPWPGAYTEHGGEMLKVHCATVVDGTAKAAPEGTVVATGRGPAVVTSERLLCLDVVQAAGRRRMSGEEFARGRPGFVGSQLAMRDGDGA